VRRTCRLGLWGSSVSEKTVNNPKVKRLVTSNVTFDLSVINQFNTDCFLAIAQQFHIPVIACNYCSFWPWTPNSFGNPDSPSYIPILFAQSSNKMSFFERLSNTFWYSFHHVHHQLPMNAPVYRIAKQRFGESLTALSLLARNTTLILVNNRFISNVQVLWTLGSLRWPVHFKPTKKLPEVRRLPIITPHILYVLY
jgi:glucuronosyltransferase